MIFYLISLFIISLLEVMESIQNSPSKDFEYRLKITLHGGKDIFRNSIELIDGFKEYLKHLNVSPNKFNYDIVIPNFAKYLELFTRSFLNIEGLDLALHIIDSLLFYFAESDIFLDINQEIKKYTSNNKLIENALSFLRYLFRFLSFQTSSDINIIAKKINLYES